MCPLGLELEAHENATEHIMCIEVARSHSVVGADFVAEKLLQRTLIFARKRVAEKSTAAQRTLRARNKPEPLQ